LIGPQLHVRWHVQPLGLGLGGFGEDGFLGRDVQVLGLLGRSKELLHSIMPLLDTRIDRPHGHARNVQLTDILLLDLGRLLGRKFAYLARPLHVALRIRFSNGRLPG